MVIFVELLKLLGGTAVLLAVLAWASRTLTLHWLSKDLELHKSRLKEDSDREVERAKAELRRAAFEFEIKFTRLHEEIVKAIVYVYPRVACLYDAVVSYLSAVEWGGEPTKEEKLKAVAERSEEFRQAYREKRVILPKRLYQKLDDLATELTAATNKFTRGLEREKRGVVLRENEDPWGEAITAVRDKIKPAFEAMHDEIQQVLGHSGVYVVVQSESDSGSPIT